MSKVKKYWPAFLLNPLFFLVNLFLIAKSCGFDPNLCNEFQNLTLSLSLLFIESLVVFLITKKQVFTYLATTPYITWLIFTLIYKAYYMHIYLSTKEAGYLQYLLGPTGSWSLFSLILPISILLTPIIAIYLANFILNKRD